MITKIQALITAALILGSTSMASAAVTHHPRQDRALLLEDSGAPARVRRLQLGPENACT